MNIIPKNIFCFHSINIYKYVYAIGDQKLCILLDYIFVCIKDVRRQSTKYSKSSHSIHTIYILQIFSKKNIFEIDENKIILKMIMVGTLTIITIEKKILAYEYIDYK